MPKYLFLFLFCFCLGNAHAQQVNKPSSNVKAADFSSFYQSTHKIKVPEGFDHYSEDGYYGFKHPELETKVLQMSVGIPVKVMQERINMLTVERPDFEIKEMSSFVLNGNDALLISGVKTEGVENIVEYVLVTGTSASTVVLKGECKEGMSYEAVLREVILSLIADF